MFGAVDIGGTKTLVAVFDNSGILHEQIKFKTPNNYEDFKVELAKVVANLSTKDFQRVAAAVPGVLDRKAGIVLTLGNLSWKNEQIAHDLEKIFEAPVVIENDAKLAGLSEAILLSDMYQKVLYITISTGIGIALINAQIIDNAVSDAGGHDMYIEFEGKRTTWEKLASGKSIYEHYRMKASEINDPTIWQAISKKIAVGLIDLIALLQPEVIVIGGGVGTHFSKYKEPLLKVLKTYETPMTKLPKIRQAKNPEQAVIYGCYALAKQYYEKRHTT